MKRRPLQHQIQDLSRQVTALVTHVQDLHGGCAQASLMCVAEDEHGCPVPCRQLKLNIQDLSRQVTALVSQVQDLQGGRQPRRGAASPATPQMSSALITSDDVISDRLVSFTDIQVMYQPLTGLDWQMPILLCAGNCRKLPQPQSARCLMHCYPVQYCCREEE